jgi:hypothetical protein
MADASTTRYALVKPEVGASSDTWGSKWNTNADDTDALLGAITTTGSANAYLLTTGLSLAAYVSGQSFLIKANFTNSGAATINVDTLGAKSLVKGASTALASGDITSGAIYHIAYDGTNFVVLNAGAGSYQASDPTLTALAALSYGGSGSSLLQFTAADTVSLTLTPSVTSVTTASATGATSAAVVAKNTTDASAVQALRIEGDRATPANGDQVYTSFYASNTSGTQVELARIVLDASALTAGGENGNLRFATVTSGGSMTNRLILRSTSLAPITDDAVSLGISGTGFSDAFFASGAVLNFNNGDVTVTHSSNALAFAGASSGYSFDAGVTASNGSGASTPAGTFTNTNDTNNATALVVEGDRATPTAGDALYQVFRLSDSAGNQTDFARFRVIATAVTNGAETGDFRIGVISSGVMAEVIRILPTAVVPNANDLAALGTTALGWSDLHLATGAVLNWANGLVTLTHDAANDCLEVAGGGFAAPLEASTETTGTLTVASRNRVINCSGGVTLDDGVFATNDWLLFDSGSSARTFTRASGLTMYVNGVDSASATLAAHQLGSAYWRSSTVVVLAGAFA